jgi:hypothetical protein
MFSLEQSFAGKKLPTKGKFLQNSFLHVAKFLYTESKFLREGGFLFGIKVPTGEKFLFGSIHSFQKSKFLREKNPYGSKVSLGAKFV